MKLTDDKILELKNNARREWNYRADQYNQWGELGRDEQDLEFARAILKEAGMEEPEGWQLVPKVPTEAMNEAAYAAKDKWASTMYCDNRRELCLNFSEPRWNAFLKAAPKYEKQK